MRVQGAWLLCFSMKCIKISITYFLVFCGVICCMVGLLIATAKIPQSAIQEKMQETADYYEQEPQYTSIVEGSRGTLIHNRADETWLSIAYCYDELHPLESTIWAGYYLALHMGLHESFLNAVREELHAAGNQQYLRYWHGAAGLMRLLHVFWNIREIVVLLVVSITILTVILIFMLWKHTFRIEAICLLLSLIMVSVWTVPFCLEYVWVFLCMLISSILCVQITIRGQDQKLGIVFLITGMFTVYLDFLTAETLTLLIPLLLVLRVSRISGHYAVWDRSVRLCFSWGVGYLGAWAMKWVIASIVLGESVMPYVQGHISERIGGSVSLPLQEFLYQSILRNIRCLFPFDYGIIGAILSLLLIVLFAGPIYTGRIRIRNHVNKPMVMLYAFIALLPYIRFLILHNHSYIHSFFTFRAQATSVLAFCFIWLEITETVPRKAVQMNA